MNDVDHAAGEYSDSRYAPKENTDESTSAGPCLIRTSSTVITPKSEIDVLAAVYAFIIRCHEHKRAVNAGHGEVATEVGHADNCSDTHSLEREVREL